MPFNTIGTVNKVMAQGNLIYGKDSAGNFYPIEITTSGKISSVAYGTDSASTTRAMIATTAGNQIIAQREYFEFRPGKSALASGMVVSGTRTGAATATSGTAAASTYWGSWIAYSPLRSGYIDGVATGGILEGQITVGLKCGAGTGTIAPTIQLANTANTAGTAITTALALATTITCTTAESYAVYDINYLMTDANINSVPFSIRMGVQHNQGGSTAVFRIMESSSIRGYYEPTS